MAVLRPFLGLRYQDAAGTLDRLIAPPFDVLTPAAREEFAARSSFNIVHVTLPEGVADDRSKYVRYARSAARLAEWRREGMIAPDARPSFYRLTQRYPMPHLGGHFARTAIVALMKLEPYGARVMPHEEAASKSREDRLRLLEATRVHLEPILGVLEDPQGRFAEAVLDAPVGTAVEARSDDGGEHRLEPIDDPETIAALVDAAEAARIWIADGHVRYEAALAFREALGERDGAVPEDFIPIALVSRQDPGLTILSNHRIVPRLPIGTETAIARLGEVFELEPHHSSRLYHGLGQARAEGRRAIAVAFEGGRGYILKPRADVDLAARMGTEGSDRWRNQDASILHRLILGELLGPVSADSVSYTADHFEAIRAADQGAAASFLLNPITVDEAMAIAEGGERLPSKTTHFFPKVPSGLLLWSLNDY
ncbi:MAG: DUF1015 family protein [Fimbriimonas sp.]